MGLSHRYTSRIRISWAFCLETLKPASWALCAGIVLSFLWGLNVVVSEAPLGTRGGVAFALGFWAVPSTLSIIIPAAMGFGVLRAVGKWVEQGSWLGLRTLGFRGLDLLPGLVFLGLLSGTATAFMTLQLEPDARGMARQTAVQSAFNTFPVGVPVNLGDVWLWSPQGKASWGEDVFFATPNFVATAEQARIFRSDSGPLVRLENGVGVSFDALPRRMEWESWQWPVSNSTFNRLELNERSTADLAIRARRTAQSGAGSEYEWAVYYKRFFHPLAACVFPIALFPLGVRRRRGFYLLGVGLGYFVIVRLGDLLASTVGGAMSAALAPLCVGLFAVVVWGRWRDGI